MPKTEHWIIYYGDGKEIASEDVLPEDTPFWDIIQITEWAEDGRTRTLHNHDYYWWLGENWACGDRADLHNYLMATHPEIKFGRTVNDSVYEKISDLAWRKVTE